MLNTMYFQLPCYKLTLAVKWIAVVEMKMYSTQFCFCQPTYHTTLGHQWKYSNICRGCHSKSGICGGNPAATCCREIDCGTSKIVILTYF